MTITEFITKLEELKAAHGDIPVAADSIMGGYYEPDPEVRTVAPTFASGIFLGGDLDEAALVRRQTGGL